MIEKIEVLSFVLLLCCLVIGCESPIDFERKNVHDPQSPAYATTAPGNVKAEIYDEEILRISWRDSSLGEKGFLVERKVGNGTYTTVISTPPGVESVFDTATEYGSFLYRVTALSEKGTSNNSISNALLVTHWAPGPPLNKPQNSPSLVKLRDGRVLSSDADHCELYDPSVKQWKLLPGPKVIRQGLKTTLLDDGRVLAIGLNGYPDTPWPGRLCAELFDPVTLDWMATFYLTDTLSYQNNVEMVVLSDGRVLLCGVIVEYTFRTSQFNRIFDPATNSFARTPDMRFKRSYHAVTRLRDGMVLATGGFNLTDSVWTKQCDLFDPRNGLWTPIAVSNSYHMYHSAFLLGDGRVYILGGTVGYGEVYNPTTYTWSPFPGPSSQEILMSVPLLKSNSLLALVGSFGEFQTHVYNVTAGRWTDSGSYLYANVAGLVCLDSGRVLGIGNNGKTWLFRL